MGWLTLLFTGLWPLLWKFGIGLGLVAGGVAWWYFSPIFKKVGLYVAAGAAIWMSAYGLGVHDEHARVIKQAELRTEQAVEDALRTRAKADAEVSDDRPAGGIRSWLRGKPDPDCNDRSQHC